MAKTTTITSTVTRAETTVAVMMQARGTAVDGLDIVARTPWFRRPFRRWSARSDARSTLSILAIGVRNGWLARYEIRASVIDENGVRRVRDMVRFDIDYDRQEQNRSLGSPSAEATYAGQLHRQAQAFRATVDVGREWGHALVLDEVFGYTPKALADKKRVQKELGLGTSTQKVVYEEATIAFSYRPPGLDEMTAEVRLK